MQNELRSRHATQHRRVHCQSGETLGRSPATVLARAFGCAAPPRGGAGFQASDYVIGRLPAGVSPHPGLTTTARPGGGPPRRIAVNVDPAESDPARLTPEEFLATVTRIKDEGKAQGRAEESRQEDRQHLWQYVLGAMLALMVAESFVAARTG